MENLFQEFKQGLTVKKNSQQHLDQQKDIDKMMNVGVLINDKGIQINPLLRRAKTYSTAKMKIKGIIKTWLSNLDHQRKQQTNFREEMITYFKNNPIGFINDGYAVMPEGTPEEYLRGRGIAYVFNGEIISLHSGYIPPENIPKDCDRFDYESNLGIIQIVKS